MELRLKQKKQVLGHIQDTYDDVSHLSHGLWLTRLARLTHGWLHGHLGLGGHGPWLGGLGWPRL